MPLTPQPPAPLHLRPPGDAVLDGRSAIELWSGDRHAATLYCERPGVRLVFQPGWEPDGQSITVQVQRPVSLYVGFANFEED